MKILQEGTLAIMLNRFMNLLLLNIRWLVCSVPLPAPYMK